MAVNNQSAQVNRRTRGMLDKQDRIFEAAAALFAERGFANVTTQQISDRADIAAGTLFRYAASKGELFLMVFNRDFRTALDAGDRAARTETDSVPALLAMVRPITAAARRGAENTAIYQRELLFGSPAEKYRVQGLELVARAEAMFAGRLAADARARGIDDPRVDEQARLTGRGIFAVLHLALARPATGVDPEHDPIEDLRAQIALLVTGFFAALTHR
ncbi:TetR family transcriptional regulator [Nocardia sp. NPDC005978]|uniref:TetR/AcrR family transcriptional regulator n=1 Tax=Nocardia sp. NPDC005978 TaxID=3156725 RepID=UPI0033B8F43A